MALRGAPTSEVRLRKVSIPTPEAKRAVAPVGKVWKVRRCSRPRERGVEENSTALAIWNERESVVAPDLDVLRRR
jgi:hypothetical protein